MMTYVQLFHTHGIKHMPEELMCILLPKIHVLVVLLPNCK